MTDRCDMACVYCRPGRVAAEPREALLTFEEIVRLARVLHSLGAQTIRLTGGEPLARRGLTELCSSLCRELPGIELALTTNGTLLARHAAGLRDAGVTRINVSLDSLDEHTFAEMTGGGDVAAVRRGLEVARGAGFTEVKTNTVVLRYRNLQEVTSIVRYAAGIGAVARFIELMPVGVGASLMAEHVPTSEVQAMLSPLLEHQSPVRAAGRGPARYVPLRSGGSVGFISAVSDCFCDGCDRVRLTAAGELRACVADPVGISLRDLVCAGATDADLVDAVRVAMATKSHHEFASPGRSRAAQVLMSAVGG